MREGDQEQSNQKPNNPFSDVAQPNYSDLPMKYKSKPILNLHFIGW
jgi:hypothetical protein